MKTTGDYIICRGVDLQTAMAMAKAMAKAKATAMAKAKATQLWPRLRLQVI